MTNAARVPLPPIANLQRVRKRPDQTRRQPGRCRMPKTVRWQKLVPGE